MGAGQRKNSGLQTETEAKPIVAEANAVSDTPVNSETSDLYLIFNTMSQGIVFQNADGEIIRANPAAERILGLSIEEMRGRNSHDPCWNPIHEDGSPYPGSEHPAMVALRTGKPVVDQIMGIAHPQKERRWLQITAIPEILPGETQPWRVYTSFTDITAIKRVEKDLQFANYSIENAADAVFWVAEDGGLRYVNKAACALLGYSHEELMKLRTYELNIEFTPESWKTHWEQLRQERSISMEARHKRKDGVIAPIEIHANYVELHGEGISFAFIRDISSQAKTLSALHEQEKHLASLYTAMTEMVVLHEIVYDNEGKAIDYRILGCNPAFESTMGIAREKAVGRLAKELYASEEAPYLHIYAHVTETGNPCTFEVHYAPMDKYFQISVFSPGKGMFATVSSDVTARRKSEEALRKSEDLFRKCFEAPLVGMATTTPDGRWLTVNDCLCEMLGYSREELMHMTWMELTPPEELLSELNTFNQFLQNGFQSVTIEKGYIHKKGYRVHAQVATAAIHDENANTAFFVSVIQDITARITAEEERRKLEAQITQAQKLESLGVLAGGIAHDFNNLLMTILGNLDLAMMDLSPVSPVRASLTEIEHAARKAADLCRQMLAYSGKGKFEIRPIALHELISEMEHMLRVSITKKAVLKFNFADNLPPIEADPMQIRQIIMNLVMNASEAIGERSGIISISTGAMHCDHSYLTDLRLTEELPEGLYVYLEVADTGHGMNKETLEKIFDPFFTTKFTGRGLGLPAVLGIMRGHHGAIKVYSEPSRGTTFKVLFPATATIAMDPFQTLGLTALDTALTGTILLVDDEETVRALGVRMLERLGFSVLTANDGLHALDVFRTHQDEIT